MMYAAGTDVVNFRLQLQLLFRAKSIMGIGKAVSTAVFGIDVRSTAAR